jgi:cell division protein FtsB
MRKRIISILFILIYIGILGGALAYSQTLKLNVGDEIYIDDLHIFINKNKLDNRTIAIVEYQDNIYLIWEGQNRTIGNYSIQVFPFKDYVYLIVSAPSNFTVRFPGEENQTLTNQTSSNQTIANQTNATITTPGNMTLNLTNITIPGIANITGNYTCSSVEECQALIEQLQKELEKVKQEKAELEKQIQYLQQQLNITQTEKKQLEEQIKILQQALEERNKKIRELEQIIAELEKEKWSWETAKEKAEEQYLLWTPYLFPVVLGSLLVYYRRYKKTKKYAEVMIDQKARELKEELLSEYLKKDILRAKIESIVDDPNLLVILRTIIPQLTGSQEITKGDILAVDIEKVAELARKRFLLKENRVEYLKKKLAELKEEIKEEVGGEE